MKRIISILLLLGLFLPVLFEGCKKPESDPLTPTNQTQNNDSTYVYTAYIGCTEEGGKKGLALLHFRQNKAKGLFQPIEILGADYLHFTYTRYDEIYATLQIAHAALLQQDPVLTKYQTDGEFWEAMFKGKSGFVKRQTLAKEQALQLIEQKSILLANHIKPRALDFADYLAAVLTALVTPAVANPLGIVQTEGLLGYASFGVGVGVTVAGGLLIGAAAATSATAAGATVVLIGTIAAGVGVGLGLASAESIRQNAINTASAISNQLNSALRLPGGNSASSSAAGGTRADPIIAGLDGAVKFLHPAGEFWAIRSKNDSFAAQVRFEPVGALAQANASTTTSLAIRTGKDVVSFTVKPLAIHVNGQAIKADFTETQLLQERAFMTRPAVNRYELTTTWGDLIEIRVNPNFNIYWYVRSLNDKRRSQVEGMLGQFNGNPGDDFQDKTGKVYTGSTTLKNWYDVFANDWRIAQTESMLVYPAGKTTESFTFRDFPQKPVSLFDFDLAARDKAEQACRKAGITQVPDLSDCMTDVLLTGMDEMAEQQALGFRLKLDKSVQFGRLADFPDKAAEGAIGLTIDDKIYAGLGKTSVDWAMYDPASDAWTTKTPFPGGKTAYFRMGTFAIGTKIYCVGGVIDGSTMTNALWEYDTQTDKWTQRKSLPGAARFNMAAFATGGKGYALFGVTGWGVGESDYPTKSALYEYDPTTDNWTQKADFPGKPRGNNITSPEYNGMVMVINGRPFVGGGSGSGAIWNDWYEYIPTRNAWGKRANTVLDDGQYFSVGTTGYLIRGNALLSYDATIDAWSKFPGKEIYVPLARNAVRGIKPIPVLNGKAYLGLGYLTSSTGNKEWWSFTP